MLKDEETSNHWCVRLSTKINFGRCSRNHNRAKRRKGERRGIKKLPVTQRGVATPRALLSYSENGTRPALFCGRHTGPVAVEFTVFLRATLQPPLSTGVEHTLTVETISLSSLPTPMRAPSLDSEREKERDGARSRKREREHRVYRPFLSHAETTCRIMTLIIAEINLHCLDQIKKFQAREIFKTIYSEKTL